MLDKIRDLAYVTGFLKQCCEFSLDILENEESDVDKECLIELLKDGLKQYKELGLK